MSDLKVKSFRKKPVVVEAVRFHEDDMRDPQVVADWCGGRVENNLGHPSGRVALVISTLEGDMTAQHGDWIIQGVHGEFYPCKPDIFAETYEEVPNATNRCGGDHRASCSVPDSKDTCELSTPPGKEV